MIAFMMSDENLKSCLSVFYHNLVGKSVVGDYLFIYCSRDAPKEYFLSFLLTPYLREANPHYQASPWSTT